MNVDQVNMGAFYFSSFSYICNGDAYFFYGNSDTEGTKLKISSSVRYRHQVWHGVRLRHKITFFKEIQIFSREPLVTVKFKMVAIGNLIC